MICSLSTGNEMRITAPDGITELVRGNDHCLVSQLEPLVRRQNIALDLKGVNRIDAAGITALISLYGCAHDSGHEFRLCNVPARVAQILTLVGLDAILLSQGTGSCAIEACLERSAA
jgi:anti-anti-sigma factor